MGGPAFRIGVSWGGYESLITVPMLNEGYASLSGVLVRVYVGLEDPDVLIEDMEKAYRSLSDECRVK